MSAATITLEQIINFLLEAPMFGDLDATQLSQIVHIMQVQRVRDGQVIFREGDPGDAWYVIYDGVADVYKTQDFLPDRRVASLGARACFGEMAILDHSPRSASVIARGDVTVFRFPRKEFESLLREDNLAAYKLIYEMAKVLTIRARNTAQQLTEALADKQAPDRLHRTSVNLVEGQSVSE
jgi:CRP-like cAMP-binding protein